jgi:hypothetical protein
VVVRDAVVRDAVAVDATIAVVARVGIVTGRRAISWSR